MTLNGQQIRLGQDFLADVLVQRQIYVPSAGGKFDGFVRYVDSFTNTTNQPTTITVYLGSQTLTEDVGRLHPTTASVRRSHHFDDALIEPKDRWLLLDDASPEGDYQAVATLVWGGGLSLRTPQY